MAVLSVHGAREHNLRAVDLELPRERLVVLCGVSGSGKSSLAFDTLHAEGQRRYLEALALHRAGVVPQLPPARVDRIDGLPPTVALAQRAPPPSARSTVGTVTEVDSVLRVLLARAGVAHCPACGRPIVPVTADEIVSRLLSLPDGARLTLEAPVRGQGAALLDEIGRAGFSRVRIGEEVVRLDDLDPRTVDGERPVRVVVDRIRVEPDRRSRLHDSVRLAARAGRGVVVAVTDDGEQTFVDRPYCRHDDLDLPALEPRLLSPFQAPGACPTCEGSGSVGEGPCPGCAGTRLSPAARAVRWRGRSLPELQAVPISALARTLAAIDGDPFEQIALPDLVRRLTQLEGLGLGDLVLARPADQLSSGELQRIRLARQVASPLSGVCYVLDEPAAGLDEVLVGRIVALLRALVERGNTVIAVEHHPKVLRAADHLVEFGPGAGTLGGRVIYQGDLGGLLAADTPTGRWLSGRERLEPRRTAAPTGAVTVSGRWLRGGAGPEVHLPRGRVVAVVGPCGSGKSSLLEALGGALEGQSPAGVRVDGADGLARPVVVDRSAARAPRSNPATFVGLWDVMRELLASTREAQLRALPASAFSLNTRGGRCEACKGTGERTLELGPLPDVVLPCPVCDGRRFQGDVLEVRWKGLDPAALLALSADEARPLLSGHPQLDAALRALVRVGLGYVPLGQSARGLSGGEARRLVLARELVRARKRGAADTAYLLDDPTSGLHPQDTAALLSLLRELADDGASVWLATHDPAVIGAADLSVPLPERPVENSTPTG